MSKRKGDFKTAEFTLLRDKSRQCLIMDLGGNRHGGGESMILALVWNVGTCRSDLDQAKPYPITKIQVWEAYQRVKANGGAAGVDQQTLDDFAGDLKGNLYKLWNRMASGSYMPPPVKRVDIPKATGGTRPHSDT